MQGSQFTSNIPLLFVCMIFFPPLGSFRIFFSFIFCNLKMTCQSEVLGFCFCSFLVFFLEFTLLGVLFVFWICSLVSDQIWDNSHYCSKYYFYPLLFLLLLLLSISYTTYLFTHSHILYLLELFHRSWIFCSGFIFFQSFALYFPVLQITI